MSSLLAKSLEKVTALPPEEQNAIASQILASLADEEAWKQRFIEKRDVIRRMAQEALDENERGNALPLNGLLRCRSRITPQFRRLFSDWRAPLLRSRTGWRHLLRGTAKHTISLRARR